MTFCPTCCFSLFTGATCLSTLIALNNPTTTNSSFVQLLFCNNSCFSAASDNSNSSTAARGVTMCDAVPSENVPASACVGYLVRHYVCVSSYLIRSTSQYNSGIYRQ